MFKQFTLALMLAGAATAAQSATFYDESVSGDLDGSAFTALGTVPLGDADIVGSIQATGSSGPDEFDRFSFELTEDTVFSVVSANEDSVFSDVAIFVYDGISSISFSDFFTSGSNGTILDAGEYSFALTGIGNRGNFDYTVSLDSVVAPVPLPAGGALLLGALGGAAMLRRRKTRG